MLAAVVAHGVLFGTDTPRHLARFQPSRKLDGTIKHNPLQQRGLVSAHGIVPQIRICFPLNWTDTDQHGTLRRKWSVFRRLASCNFRNGTPEQTSPWMRLAASCISSEWLPVTRNQMYFGDWLPAIIETAHRSRRRRGCVWPPPVYPPSDAPVTRNQMYFGDWLPAIIETAHRSRRRRGCVWPPPVYPPSDSLLQGTKCISEIGFLQLLRRHTGADVAVDAFWPPPVYPPSDSLLQGPKCISEIGFPAIIETAHQSRRRRGCVLPPPVLSLQASVLRATPCCQEPNAWVSGMRGGDTQGVYWGTREDWSSRPKRYVRYDSNAEWVQPEQERGDR